MGKPEVTIKTLWGVAKCPELRLTSEELHMIVEQKTGKDSIKKLNKRELERVVYYLCSMKDSAMRDRRTRKKPASGNEATVNQRKKIVKLTEEAGWNRARVNGLCKKMFQVDAVEWLNYLQCSDLIEALKAIVKRKEDGERGKNEQDTQKSAQSFGENGSFRGQDSVQ